MANSLGDEICLYLQTKSLGLNFNGPGTINLFSTLMIDQPDLATAVIERGGIPPLLTMTGKSAPASKFDQPTIQIRVRAGMTDYTAGNALAQGIFAALQGQNEVILNPPHGTLFHLIQALQSPTYLGRDERQRHMWSQNMRIMLENDQR